MGKSVKPGRPFLKAAAPDTGIFRAPGSVDDQPRLFAWHRLEGSGLIAVVGLAEAPLFAPLEKQIKMRWRDSKTWGTCSALP